MSTWASPSATLSHVSAVPPVSPVQWKHAFAYTPDSGSGQPRNDCQLVTKDVITCSNEDALPTQFHSCRSQSCSVSPGGALSSRRGSLPRKHKQQNRGRPSANLDRRTRQHMNKAWGGCDRDLSPSRSSTPSAHCKTRRIMLDAVEIINKEASHSLMPLRRLVRARSRSTRVVRSASSHDLSLPISCAYSDVIPHHNSSYAACPPTERGESTSPESSATLCVKTSKYFNRALPHCLTPRDSAVLTPSSSIPVYNKSSDFEHPPPDPALNEVADGLDKLTCAPSWYNSFGLYDDLVLMLGRLKPILIQESVRDDPWKVLIAVRLLNVTTGKAAIPVFCKIMSRWPTPQDLMYAPHNDLVELLRPLGLYNKRAKWLKDMSAWFCSVDRALDGSSAPLASLLCDDRITAAALREYCPGVGSYAIDSLRIFCASDENTWKRVTPRDKELIRYLRWRWAIEEGKVWYHEGVIGDVDVPYLITLVDELAAHYDGTIGGNGYMYHFYNDMCDRL